MFYIQQVSQMDCGFTCLKIYLANIHHDSNYLFLVNPFEKECSFFELKKLAIEYGVTFEAYKATNKDEISSIDKVPFIARTQIEDSYHALYVYKIGKKYIYYVDPSSGKKKILKEEFISMWTGEFLISKEVNKYKCPITKPKLVKRHEYILGFIIELISILSVLFAVYYINKDSYIYIPIIFFTVMLISEITLKKYMMYLMKKVDTRVESLIVDIKNKDYSTFYKSYENYKKYLLINNFSLVSSLLIFLLISIVILINEKMNFIYIVLNLLLAIIYAYIVKPLLSKDELEIVSEENKISKTNDKLEAFSYMNMARDISYKYVDKIEAYKYVSVAIQVILTFIMMMYFSLISVSYIICYTVLQYYLYSNLTSLLSKSDDFMKQDNLLNKLLNIIENK